MNPYLNHTDTELVTLLSQGERKAFDMIYKRYAADLYQYARKNISIKEDCEEIVQEVFESLWARHKNLQVQTLKFYLLKMVRYKVIRYFQHNAVKRKYTKHFILFEALYDQFTDDDKTIDPEMLQQLIDKSLEELPQRCQTAFRLRWTQNLSNGEIAAQMNIDKLTVKNYIVTALSHLRKSYQNFSQAN